MEPGDLEAVLFTRDDLPTPARKRRDVVVRELRFLDDHGELDDVAVVDWAKRVPVEAPSPARERYEEFAGWATQAGVRLSPFFDTRSCYSMQTGSKREELVLPALCLAVYEDGELATVAPHADGPHTVSVEDVIDRLEVGGSRDDADVATIPTH